MRNARRGRTVAPIVDITAHPISIVRWQVAAVAATISLVSMPLTAIWFLVLGPLTLVLGAVAAALARSPRRTTEILGLAGGIGLGLLAGPVVYRSEEHTSELQSLMRISYAVFCLKKKNNIRSQIRPRDF